MMTGAYKVNKGTVEIEGKEIQNKALWEIVGRNGRTFQNIRLFPTMRVIENVSGGDHINIQYNFLDLLFQNEKFRKAEKRRPRKRLIC